jgi:hypothetical protein
MRELFRLFDKGTHSSFYSPSLKVHSKDDNDAIEMDEFVQVFLELNRKQKMVDWIHTFVDACAGMKSGRETWPKPLMSILISFVVNRRSSCIRFSD